MDHRISPPLSAAPSVEGISPPVHNDQQYDQVQGRAYGTQNEAHTLPVDRQEHARLKIQYEAHRLLLNGLYPAPDQVRRALTPGDGDPAPGILDVGTGSGIWAVEMAKEFPRASVVGMDLAGPSDLEAPSNCRFEIDDANLDLGHYAQSFNVVNMRSIKAGITSFRDTIHNVAQTLRTNGILILADSALQLYSESKEPLPTVAEGQPGWTACQTVLNMMASASRPRGADIESAVHWHSWLVQDPLFEQVGRQDELIPVGPWLSGADARATQIAELARTDLLLRITSFREQVSGAGYQVSLLDRLIAVTKEELRDMRPKVYVKSNFVWATRTGERWTRSVQAVRGA